MGGESDAFFFKVSFTRDFYTVWISFLICECPVHLQMIKVFLTYNLVADCPMKNHSRKNLLLETVML